MKCTLDVGSLSLSKGKVEGPDLTSFVRHFPPDSKGTTFSLCFQLNKGVTV